MKTPVRLFLSVALIACLFSCKKSIDDLKKDYVLGVLTNGRWFLDGYSVNEADISWQFSEYEFQFYENGKMEAITATTLSTGTWSGDVNNLTFTVKLPSSDPKMVQMNYVWKWIKSNIGVVFAENVSPTQKITIRLKKK